MPIYAYKCASCGHAQDVLQKISDEPLTVCPSCGASTFTKQVTAAGFQLKGSGWYVTDFRDGGSKKNAASTETKTESKDSTKDSAAATTSPTSPTPAPSAAPAAASSSPSPSPSPSPSSPPPPSS